MLNINDFLYVPPDLNEASSLWKANCAPGAVAAILKFPLLWVRHAFPWFPDRPWTSPTQLGQALTSLGQEHRWTAYGVKEGRGPLSEQVERMPKRGLIVVQIDGPWCDLANKRVAYRYTHTAAVYRWSGVIPLVYDINIGEDGGWTSVGSWADRVMGGFVEDTKRSTGWFIRSVFEIAG